jgi:hypothetical protein
MFDPYSIASTTDFEAARVNQDRIPFVPAAPQHLRRR